MPLMITKLQLSNHQTQDPEQKTMSSSLADYLAKNYLTADPAPPGQSSSRPKKKRKKTKQQESGDQPSGLIIADDDPPSLRTSANEFDEENPDEPYVLDTTHRSAEFRKTKKSNWKVVQPGKDVGKDEADAVLASAEAERAARRDADEAENAPIVEGIEDDVDDGTPRMESGARAGLQTAEQTAALIAAQERRRRAEIEAFQRQQKEGSVPTQETIYRDASGRIINVAMKRAEARRAAEEAKAKAEREKEALMGDVQRREREERRAELAAAKMMPLSRTIEDEELNAELRARQRWNDPAAQFLTNKSGPGKSATGKPLYQGPYPPNRYGIRPGHRWDGVDRSNGFEKEWFQARVRKERSSALEYAWQMDE